MFAKTIDAVLQRLCSQDGWRGVLYVISAAAGIAGYEKYITPEVSALIISAGLGISGVLHVVWHKTHPELPDDAKK